MQKKYLARVQGPSQYQTINIHIPYDIAMCGEATVQQYVDQVARNSLDPIGWTLVEPEGLTLTEIEECTHVSPY